MGRNSVLLEIIFHRSISQSSENSLDSHVDSFFVYFKIESIDTGNSEGAIFWGRHDGYSGAAGAFPHPPSLARRAEPLIRHRQAKD